MTKKTISVKEDILDENTKKARTLHDYWVGKHTFVINIMASPGAGKTTFLETIIPLLRKTYSCSVIEGDVVDLDVNRLQALHIPVIRANTGGSCHLDAVMIEKIQKKLPLTDIVFIENVGNLICPSHFAIGQHMNIVIASVPEGDDKPVKYPHVFETTDAVILNKMDLVDACGFDMKKFKGYLQKVNPDIPLFPVSCKDNEGIEKLTRWIKKIIENRL